jgi:Fur family transcriptional regulator, ferric uptake regulator
MKELKSQRLKLHGCKATPQRRLILDTVNAIETHFTPQELYGKLLIQNPAIGLVTVYRTLKLLSRLRLVCEIETPGQAHRYTRRPSEHHHHLVCARCSKVVNFNHCKLDDLSRELARETGFSISGHHLEFTGLCADCQKTVEPTL